MPIEYAPAAPKYNAAMCETMNITPLEGYTAIEAERPSCNREGGYPPPPHTDRLRRRRTNTSALLRQSLTRKRKENNMLLTSLLNALPGAVTQGLIWGLMAIGVYITYRILDVADLTVDGSLALGGAACVMLIRGGVNPWLALLIAALCGAAAGFITGTLHTRCGIPAILAGILTQLALYSVNLRIMGGKANQAVSVDKYDLIVSQRFVRQLSLENPMPLLLLVTALLIAALYWFFGTEIGCGIRATGANARMARAQGINTQRNVVVGLALSNGIAALSGALLCQYQGSADVNMGRGAIVIGLAAVIIGESLLGKVFRNFGLRMLSVSLGAIVYYLVLQVVLQLGLNTNDLKLLSAAIVAVFLAIPHLKGKLTHKGGTVHA